MWLILQFRKTFKKTSTFSVLGGHLKRMHFIDDLVYSLKLLLQKTFTANLHPTTPSAASWEPDDGGKKSNQTTLHQRLLSPSC